MSKAPSTWPTPWLRAATGLPPDAGDLPIVVLAFVAGAVVGAQVVGVCGR